VVPTVKSKETFINYQRDYVVTMYSDYEYLIKSDLSKYAGKWVAICDSKVVASSKHIQDLVKATKLKCGTKKAVITKISNSARIL